MQITKPATKAKPLQLPKLNLVKPAKKPIALKQLGKTNQKPVGLAQPPVQLMAQAKKPAPAPQPVQSPVPQQ